VSGFALRLIWRWWVLDGRVEGAGYRHSHRICIQKKGLDTRGWHLIKGLPAIVPTGALLTNPAPLLKEK
jgi:hypothetical protein